MIIAIRAFSRESAAGSHQWLANIFQASYVKSLMANLNTNQVGWKASSSEGVVAAGSSESFMAGVNILNDGGNAIDAAIATIFA
ncbi:MAG: hypothetical protein CM1200mP6_06540 [Anaerolineaceae bacterium]|nr:MAG: hypothetical protein CM1200mP6_06540 [Anaerolineaceae bacterium]